MVSKGSRINHYTPEFKDEAVRYWKDSGKSVHECAGDLGVKPSTFARWAPSVKLVDAADYRLSLNYQRGSQCCTSTAKS